MRGGERAPGMRSNLDKPLEELTDEDIVQLTREDCRRYLKEKGMRRPSWNKSQAIQQVLSLKRLFESRLDDEKKSTKQKPVVSPVDESAARASVPQEKRHGASSSKEVEAIRPKRVTETQGLLADAQIPRLASRPSQAITECPRYAHREIVSAGHGVVPQQSFAGLSSSFPTECPSRIEDRQLFSTLLRSPSISQPTAQLTIFYSGMVNVYDDIPADKAHAIMLLAGSGNYFCPPLIPNGFETSKAYQGAVYVPSLTNVPTPPLLPSNSETRLSAPAAAVSSVPNGTNSGNPKRLVSTGISISFRIKPVYNICCPGVLFVVDFSYCLLQTFNIICSGFQPELPKSRKASVQRFLKKRKDRGRLKTVSCAPSKKHSFEMYINPQINSLRSSGRPFHSPLYEHHRQTLNGKISTQSSGSETSSPTRPPQTPRRSSSNDDQGNSREQNEESFNVGSEDNKKVFAGEGEATSPSQYRRGKE